MRMSFIQTSLLITLKPALAKVKENIMAIEIKMPALSPTMTEGRLSKWLVSEGDEVRSGDLLAEIGTDKATMEVEAVDEGVVSEIILLKAQIMLPLAL